MVIESAQENINITNTNPINSLNDSSTSNDSTSSTPFITSEANRNLADAILITEIFDHTKIMLENTHGPLSETGSPSILCSTLPSHWRCWNSLQMRFKVISLSDIPDGTRVEIHCGNEETDCGEIINNKATMKDQIAEFRNLRFIESSGRNKYFSIFISIISNPVQIVSYNETIRISVDGPREPSRMKSRNYFYLLQPNPVLYNPQYMNYAQHLQVQNTHFVQTSTSNTHITQLDVPPQLLPPEINQTAMLTTPPLKHYSVPHYELNTAQVPATSCIAASHQNLQTSYTYNPAAPPDLHLDTPAALNIQYNLQHIDGLLSPTSSRPSSSSSAATQQTSMHSPNVNAQSDNVITSDDREIEPTHSSEATSFSSSSAATQQTSMHSPNVNAQSDNVITSDDREIEPTHSSEATSFSSSTNDLYKAVDGTHSTPLCQQNLEQPTCSRYTLKAPSTMKDVYRQNSASQSQTARETTTTQKAASRQRMANSVQDTSLRPY